MIRIGRRLFLRPTKAHTPSRPLDPLDPFRSGPGALEKAFRAWLQDQIVHLKKRTSCRAILGMDEKRLTGSVCLFGPCLHRFAKIFDSDLEMRRWIVFEANQRVVDHAHRPLDLSEIGIEPERDRQLDQSFEKGLIGIFGFLIELFQCLMGLKNRPSLNKRMPSRNRASTIEIPQFNLATSFQRLKLNFQIAYG